MVGRIVVAAAGAVVAAWPGLAASPWDQMFSDPGSCYQRVYSAEHLASHPTQRVKAMALAAAPDIPGDPWPAVALAVTLRGSGGGAAEAVAYCENEGGSTLYCTLEGDAGAFTVVPARQGAVLVTSVGRGIGLETDTAFVTLEATRGDDRSFLLQPTTGCR